MKKILIVVVVLIGLVLVSNLNGRAEAKSNYPSAKKIAEINYWSELYTFKDGDTVCYIAYHRAHGTGIDCVELTK